MTHYAEIKNGKYVCFDGENHQNFHKVKKKSKTLFKPPQLFVSICQ